MSKQSHIEIRDEILSIQQYVICIAANNLLHKVNIHKKRVSKFALDYLSAYFQTQVIPADDNNRRMIVIKSEHCSITVEEDDEQSYKEAN